MKDPRGKKSLISYNYQNVNYRFRPGSDAVLHMSRIEFNELSSCEVRRLNRALVWTISTSTSLGRSLR